MTHLERANKKLKKARRNLEAARDVPEKQLKDLREKVDFWEFVVGVMEDYMESDGNEV